jgi:hypothetical protein
MQIHASCCDFKASKNREMALASVSNVSRSQKHQAGVKQDTSRLGQAAYTPMFVKTSLGASEDRFSRK